MSDQGTDGVGGRGGSPGWSMPGEGTPGTAASPIPTPVAPSAWVAPPGPGGSAASPSGATPRKRTPPAVVALIVVGAVAFVAFAGWFKVFIEGRDDSGTSTYFYEEGVSTTAHFSGSVEPAPAVVVPPADAASATVAIEELYQRVFTPTESTELWNQLITEPAGLREKLRVFGSSPCSIGTETVVTKVQFTGADTADVQLRFDGPNIPEFGRSYLFDGRAVRQTDGSWKATPDAVLQVVGLASRYCG